MTENGKLDLILAKLQGIETEVQAMKAELQTVNKKVERLEIGQLEIKKELYIFDRRLSDVYRLALDAWGQGVENRVWLENGGLKV